MLFISNSLCLIVAYIGTLYCINRMNVYRNEPSEAENTIHPEKNRRMMLGFSIVMFMCSLQANSGASVQTTEQPDRPFVSTEASVAGESFDISDLVKVQSDHLEKAIKGFTAHNAFFKSVDAILAPIASVANESSRSRGFRHPKHKVVRKYVIEERTTTPQPVSPSLIEVGDLNEAILSCVVSLPKIMSSELQILAEFVDVQQVSRIMDFLHYVKQTQIAMQVMTFRRDQAKNLLELVQQVVGLSKTKKLSFIQLTSAYLDICEEEMQVQDRIKNSFTELAKMMLQNERARIENAAAAERQLTNEVLKSYEILELEGSFSDWVVTTLTDETQESVGFDPDDSDYDKVQDFAEYEASSTPPV
jgi:hypothetical protein